MPNQRQETINKQANNQAEENHMHKQIQGLRHEQRDKHTNKQINKQANK